MATQPYTPRGKPVGAIPTSTAQSEDPFVKFARDHLRKNTAECTAKDIRKFMRWITPQSQQPSRPRRAYWS